MLSDPCAKDENKLKAAQELSENLEVIVSSPQYPAFLDHAMKNFLKILQDSEPLFIAEYNIQQVRKLILEMFHRLPTNEHLRPYVKQSLSLMFRLLERENEDNVLISLQIIIEIHQQDCPKYSVKIQTILQSIKGIYHDDSPKQRNKILEPRSPIEGKDLSKLNFELGVAETFITATVVLTETQTPDGNNISYNLIPKGVLSLKVLQELPIIVVLMYQLYKPNVHHFVVGSGCSDKQAIRYLHQTAVTAMFVAAAIKELRQAILPINSFVELCLTVPVRLSSLLPHLPMLMVNKNWTSYFILFGRKIVFNFIYFCTQIFSRILFYLL